MRRSSCVSLGSSALSGWDRSVSLTVRSRRGSEPDAPRKPGASRLTGRCEPARLGKENAELRLDRAVPRQPRPPILPGRRSGDPLPVFVSGSSNGPIRSSVHASPVGCSRSGLPRWCDRPLSPRTALMGNPGRDRRRPSRVTADLRRLRVHDPAETSRPGGTAPSRWLGSWPNPSGVGAWAQETVARQTVEPRRAPTSLVGTSPLMRQTSAGSPASPGFGCVDAKPSPGRDPRPHDRATAGRSMGQRQTSGLVVNAL